MVYRAGNSGINLEEDDEEEEFTWDAEPTAAANTNAAVSSGTPGANVSGETSISTHNSIGDGMGNVSSSTDLKVLELKEENDKLKGIVKTLTGRVTFLEQQLATTKLENETQAKLIITLQQQLTSTSSSADAVQKSVSRDSNKVENNNDNVSQCSGDSGIVLHNSDTMSFPDEDSRHGIQSSTTTTSGQKATLQPSSHTSKTTRAYLAAVDDADEDAELDGWN